MPHQSLLADEHLTSVLPEHLQRALHNMRNQLKLPLAQSATIITQPSTHSALSKYCAPTCGSSLSAFDLCPAASPSSEECLLSMLTSAGWHTFFLSPDQLVNVQPTIQTGNNAPSSDLLICCICHQRQPRHLPS